MGNPPTDQRVRGSNVLSPNAKLLHARLSELCMEGDGVAEISQHEIADSLGLTDKTIQRATVELEEIGLLTVYREVCKLSMYTMREIDSVIEGRLKR